MDNLSELAQSEGTPREYQRLKAIYPLFEWTWDAESRACRWRMNSVSSSVALDEYGRPKYRDSESSLRHYHCEATIKKQFSEQYPHLYFGISVGKDGVRVDVYVFRNDRDGEPMGHKNICDSFLHDWLGQKESESIKAKQDGFFYCCGHNRVEKRAEGGYFWFAGRYCKEYGDENPKHRSDASRETYN